MIIQESIKPSNSRLILSLIGIFYVWCLPFLAKIGFAEKDSNSISEFISNPPATGAMACISFIPLSLMWDYQDKVIDINYENILDKNILSITLKLFQLFYGLFLICTYNYVPIWLHTTSVILFCFSFILHSIIILSKIESTKPTKYILFIGISAFLSLTFAEEMWFWFFECIGFTSMLLFTPIEWYYYEPRSLIFDSDL